MPVIILKFDSKGEIINNADHNRLPNGAFGQANLTINIVTFPPCNFRANYLLKKIGHHWLPDGAYDPF